MTHRMYFADAASPNALPARSWYRVMCREVRRALIDPKQFAIVESVELDFLPSAAVATKLAVKLNVHQPAPVAPLIVTP